MADGTAAESSTVTGAPPPAGAEAVSSATATPQIFVDERGNLKEGWRQNYVPEDIRSDKIFDGFKNLSDLTKSVCHAERQLRRAGKVMPEDTAPKSEWDVFYKSIGRPDTPDGYKYIKPEDIHIEDMSPEYLKKTFEGFHKIGLNQKAAEGVINIYCDHLREIEKQLDEIELRETEEAERIIREESGTAYESRLHLANRMISENTQGWPEEKKAKLLDALNDNALKPYVLDMLANVAGRFMEHRIIPESEFMGGKTPKQVEGEIAELKNTKGFILLDDKGQTLKSTNPDEYKRLVDKLHGLEDELRSMSKR
jgi:hypothetical protein